jgi:DNA polymerase-3 subunit delta'
MRFSEIAGQEGIKARLIQAVRTNRVSHALMLTGSPGCGHFTLALALAQYLQCENPGEEDSCGSCPSCHQAAGLIHPDIHFVFPVARTAKIKEEPCSDDFIEEWRAYLGENPYPSLAGWYHAMGIENKQAGIFTREAKEILRKLSFKTFESDYKVMIVWMPEKMNAAAANKLLKIIEEPADHTVFLFVSEGTDDILPTILSRTQLVKVPRIGKEALRIRLNNDFPGQEKIVEGAVMRAQGDYITARDLIEQSEQGRIDRERFIRWMRASFALQVPDIIRFVNEISDIGRERQKGFLQYCIGMIHNNFLLNQDLPDLAVMDRDEEDFSVRFSRYIHPENIAGLMKEFDLAISQIAMNGNPKILFTDMSFRLYRLMRPAENATKR